MHDDQPLAARSITLLGGGPVDPHQLHQALALAPTLVAADGGAEHAHHLDLPVTKIVGDLDSLTNLQFWRDQGVDLVKIDEQDSTDFEKCLYTVEADVYIGVGFLGRRLDHTLACLRTLAAYPKKRVVLVGDGDVTFLCPMVFNIDLPAMTRVSIFPMAPVTCGPSHGLRWPLEGLEMVPDGQIGTSNQALGGTVNVQFSDAAALMVLPVEELGNVVTCLLRAP